MSRTNAPDLMAQRQAADYLGVSVRSMQVYVQERILRCVRRRTVGRRTAPYFERAELDRFLAEYEGAA